MIQSLRAANLALAFLLELALLGAYGAAGLQVHTGTVLRICIGVGAPVLVILVWGVLLAPNARRRLPLPSLLVLKVAMFGGAVMGLLLVRQIGPALALGVVAALNLGLAAWWHQT